MQLRDIVRGGIAASLGLVTAVSSNVRADLQDDLNARWRGAWVIVKGDIASNCNGLTTDNRVSGDLSSASGRFSFKPGELARLEKVDAKRSRVDVVLALEENVLIPYQDGPFTLYREGSCKIELEIDFGSGRTKDLGMAGVEAQFVAWFERHARLDDALASPAYNLRVREDYPKDYAQTLIAYENWKIDRHNELVTYRIAASAEETRLLLAQVVSDDQFGAGLAKGIAAMRPAMVDDCSRLLSSSVGTFGKKAEAPNEKWAEGYKTGQALAYHIELGRRLGMCFIERGDAAASLD
jgi:hypothetical protein